MSFCVILRVSNNRSRITAGPERPYRAQRRDVLSTDAKKSCGGDLGDRGSAKGSSGLPAWVAWDRLVVGERFAE
jgi:hypothetical protein